MQRGTTGLGYEYYRDRSGGRDVTVYEHQLVALLDNHPEEVFREDTHVHHRDVPKWCNARSRLEVTRRDTHDGRDHR